MKFFAGVRKGDTILIKTGQFNYEIDVSQADFNEISYENE